MICIRITEREDGLELSAHGHAGYAPRGQDVVCAGVSALLYGFISYLEGLLPIATEKTPREGTPRLETPQLEVEEGDGLLKVRTYGMGGADLDGLAVIRAGLGLIASGYPSFVMLDANIHRKGDEYESN
ncbi:MAG: ribosomal-processing cysteine protease Prp [Clostridia bacterium]|nr:ribosomal-processing cysteine protease Prp [Clostridia bacterium]